MAEYIKKVVPGLTDSYWRKLVADMERIKRDALSVASGDGSVPLMPKDIRTLFEST